MGEKNLNWDQKNRSLGARQAADCRQLQQLATKSISLLRQKMMEMLGLGRRLEMEMLSLVRRRLEMEMLCLVRRMEMRCSA